MNDSGRWKMYKENEIHREYEIEEFIFDICIKEPVKELLGRYRSDFRANKDSNFFVRDLTMEFRGCKFRFIGSPIPLATDQCFRS